MQNLNFNFVLPSLRISGGIKETLKLAEEISSKDAHPSYFIMWKSPNEISDTIVNSIYLCEFETNAKLAIFQLPLIFLRFVLYVLLHFKASRSAYWIFTHYTTFPLSLVIPRNRRAFFVQGMEWRFIKNKFASNLLKTFIIYFYNRGLIFTANRFLTLGIKECQLSVAAELPIWADREFWIEHSGSRSYDLVMVLRKGEAKRLDLYLDFLQSTTIDGKNWNIAVITPDAELVGLVQPYVNVCIIKPSIEAMKLTYAQSKFFLLLSEHEGFGLPPLEAMGAGCVPICRDAGGIRAYMQNELAQLVLPLNMEIEDIIQFVAKLISENRWSTYSPIARRIFTDGLKKSQSRATTLINLSNQ